MKLSETVEMMNSADYKERFKAEYLQDEIRANGLKNMLDKWDEEQALKNHCGQKEEVCLGRKRMRF